MDDYDKKELFTTEDTEVTGKRLFMLLSYFNVGAKKLSGIVFHVSPEGVKHMDVLNNLFAQWCQSMRSSCE